MKLTMKQAEEAILRDIYASFYSLDGKFSTPKITGQPGIGKSSIATQVAKSIGGTSQALNTQILEKGDIIGIPFKSENKDDGELYVEFVKHYIFKHINDLVKEMKINLTKDDVKTKVQEILKTKSSDVDTLADLILTAKPSRRGQLFGLKGTLFTPSVLLIDEINRGDEGVRKEMMNILLDRVVNGFAIPWFVYLIAACNPVGYGMETIALDHAQENRFKSFDVYASLEEWINLYATKIGINDLIIEFLTIHDELFTLDETRLKRITGAFPTPRSWTAVHTDITRAIAFKEFDPRECTFRSDEDRKTLLIDISGRVGDLAAETFISFIQDKEKFINTEDLFNVANHNGDKLSDTFIKKINDLSEKAVRESYFTNKLVKYVAKNTSKIIDDEGNMKILADIFERGIKSESSKNLFTKLIASTMLKVNGKSKVLFMYFIEADNMTAKNFARSLAERSKKLNEILESFTS